LSYGNTNCTHHSILGYPKILKLAHERHGQRPASSSQFLAETLQHCLQRLVLTLGSGVSSSPLTPRSTLSCSLLHKDTLLAFSLIFFPQKKSSIKDFFPVRAQEHFDNMQAFLMFIFE
jgi:hypothetical protein